MTRRTLTRRWPTAALVAKAGGRKALCHRLGIKPRTLPRDIDDVQADRWAVRCGWHPEQVWPGWCDAGLRYVDAVFVTEGWRPAWLHQLEARPDPAVDAA